MMEFGGLWCCLMNVLPRVCSLCLSICMCKPIALQDDQPIAISCMSADTILEDTPMGDTQVDKLEADTEMGAEANVVYIMGLSIQ